MSIKGKVENIFSSFQGEGLFIGVKQLFIRLHGCNLTCSYCDTNTDNYKEYTSAELFSEVRKYFVKERYHSISITGGEPLMQSLFLKDFLPLLKESDLKVYLETNGTLVEDLKNVIEYVDYVAVDFKLPSTTSLKGYWEEHAEFLKMTAGKDCFVKVIVAPDTNKTDFIKAVKIIEKDDYINIPLIIQPQTEYVPLSEKFRKKIEGFVCEGSSYINDIRLIPQAHKFLDVE